jgi:hypothetical protein
VKLALQHGPAPGVLLGCRLAGEVSGDLPLVVLVLEEACDAGCGESQELLGVCLDLLPQGGKPRGHDDPPAGQPGRQHLAGGPDGNPDPGEGEGEP